MVACRITYLKCRITPVMGNLGLGRSFFCLGKCGCGRGQISLGVLPPRVGRHIYSRVIYGTKAHSQCQCLRI